MIKRLLFFSIFTSILLTNGQAQNPSLEWVKRIGNSNNDFGTSITLDSLGNLYSTGKYNGLVDFDSGASTYTIGYGGFFICKFDPFGNINWGKSIATIGESNAITIDFQGNIYITGYFKGATDFDPGPNVFYMSSDAGGYFDIFVLKLNPNGDFLWAKSISGPHQDWSNSIKTDLSGSVYFTGRFKGTVDFDPGSGLFNLSSGANNDIFISKLDSSGNFIWAKAINGINNGGEGNSISIDRLGNLYTTGMFYGVTDFDPDGIATYTLSPQNSAEDIYILKLDPLGNFVWAKKIGGIQTDISRSITTDALGNVYNTGFFEGTVDFDPGTGIYDLASSAGHINPFVLKLNTQGDFLWAKSFIGGGGEGFALALDKNKNVYATGTYGGNTDFDPGSGVYNLSGVGSADIFVSKLDSLGDFVWALSMGGTNNDFSSSIAIDTSNNIYTTGCFYETADFDFGAGVFNLTSAGNNDLFIHKMGQNLTTGIITTPSDSKGISIYPNPNNGSFTIDLNGKAQILIIDILGNEILRDDRFETHRKVELNNVSNGIYFVKALYDNGKSQIFKLIKE